MLLLVTGAFLAVSVAPALAVHTMAPVEGAVLNVDVWAGWVGDPPDYTPHVDFTQSFNVVYTGSVDRTYTFGAITMTLNGRWGGRNRAGCCPATPNFTDRAMMLTWGGPWDTDTVAGTSDRNVTVSGLTPGVTYDTSIWSWEAQDGYGFDISANGVLVVDDFVISSVPSHNDDNRNDFQSIADDAGVVVFTYSDPTTTSTTYKINGIRMTPLAAGPARTWNIDGSGDWNAGANWTFGESPNANDESAFFGPAISSTQTVFTNSAVTVKAITFGDADAGTVQQSYVIAGQGSVDLESDTSTSTVSVLEGSHQFQMIVNLNNATDVDVAPATTLDFDNALNLNGFTLTKTGAGIMNIDNQLNSGAGAVIVSAGVLGGTGEVGGDLSNNGGTVAPGNSTGTLSVAGNYAQTTGSGSLAIEIDGSAAGEFDVLKVTGNLDISDGTLDVAFNALPGKFKILDVTGTSSVAFSSLSHTGGLDISLDGSDLASTGELIVLSALLGDMDGDLAVTTADAVLLVQALVDQAAYDANGFFVVSADFNGNVDGGAFDSGDLNAFSALLGGPASAVPEPASASLLFVALGVVVLVGRRRKVNPDAYSSCPK